MTEVDRKKAPKPEIPWRERPFLPLVMSAELLGLSPASLYRLESEGQLAFRRLAGRTLVAVPSIIKLIDAVDEWTPSSTRGAVARAAREERARKNPLKVAQRERDLAIVAALQSGRTTRQVGKDFGVSHARVAQIGAQSTVEIAKPAAE